MKSDIGTGGSGGAATIPGPAARANHRDAGGLTEQMARYALEEYVRLGLSSDDIVDLFQDPANRLLYSFYRSRGHTGVEELVFSLEEHARM
jgi:hypothetical protein